MPDHTTGRRADKSVVPGDMAGDAADGRAFEAALRVGGGAHQANNKISGWPNLSGSINYCESSAPRLSASGVTQSQLH